MCCALCFRIHCMAPAGVQLKPQIPRPENLPPCPITADSGLPIPAHNYRPTHISVVVTDDQGREFDNISSLHFDWKLSDSNLGRLNTPEPVRSSQVLLDGAPAGVTCKSALL